MTSQAGLARGPGPEPVRGLQPRREFRPAPHRSPRIWRAGNPVRSSRHSLSGKSKQRRYPAIGQDNWPENRSGKRYEWLLLAWRWDAAHWQRPERRSKVLRVLYLETRDQLAAHQLWARGRCRWTLGR